MKVGFKVIGGQDIARRLEELPARLSLKVQQEALLAGAEPIRRLASELAPRDAHAGPPHLADNIAVGVGRTRGREGEAVVEIGPEYRPDDLFYGYFVEVGTRYMAARPYLRPAFDNAVRTALGVVVDRFWAALRQRAPGTFTGGASTGGRTVTGGQANNTGGRFL